MATFASSLEFPNQSVWYARYLKVAAAVAIIRCRPAGTTGRQYAEMLASRYQQSQLAWKHKIANLQEESLILKQKLIQHELIDDDTDVERIEDTSSDSDDNAFLTPPCSIARKRDISAVDGVTDVDRGILLSQHVSFLQNILVLGSMRSTRETSQGTELESVQRMTVETALNYTVDWLCRSVDDSSISSGMAASSSATSSGRRGSLGTVNPEMADRVVEIICKMTDCKRNREVRELVVGAVRKLVHFIVENQKLNNIKYQQNICRYIANLARSANLLDGILLELFKAILEVADMLSRATRGLCSFESYKLENICHVFRCTEEILNRGRSSLSLSGNGTMLLQLQNLLDRSILHISEQYPLFAYYVWHIAGIVEGLQVNHVSV